jgi:hypothetical protein
MQSALLTMSASQELLSLEMDKEPMVVAVDHVSCLLTLSHKTLLELILKLRLYNIVNRPPSASNRGLAVGTIV